MKSVEKSAQDLTPTEVGFEEGRFTPTRDLDAKVGAGLSGIETKDAKTGGVI
jgi:hypothetical protein